ncbi:MAG: glycoside hydrolase family 3 C-terminal domain-containing protein [Clostridiales bacterium]|jgi:beta-glucosidase|nr:glycoside hydrolase family 3 C-terminal domain-containing protein [Clostridiales bacterium]
MKPAWSIKALWKTRRVKAWAVTAPILLALLIAAVTVTSAVLLVYGTLNSMFGGQRRVLKSGDPSRYIRYEADYANKSEVLAAANLLNEKICEEGIILLKNEDDALPLAASQKISVFGKNSVNLVLGGSGSSAGSGNGGGAGLYESLQSAGFAVNPVMKAFYDNTGSPRPSAPAMGSVLTGFPTAETAVSSYTAAVKSSYADYPDAALAVISRIGGEGYDLPRSMFWNGSNYAVWNGDQTVPGARGRDDHYLQLDQNETDMLKEACANFDKVIVVINCSTSMELGFLDDPGHYAYNPKIKAALWIGNPGGSGIAALGRVLNGSVNPSGKTVDLYARDFKQDPTWQNFGNNLVQDGNRYTLNGAGRNAYFVEYEEGIYTGYRYYETRGYDENDGGVWYRDHVVYPFGYGLSYTNFDWAVGAASPASGSALAADGAVSVPVAVTNTGAVAGKEVVQLYYTAPYTKGEIEKARVVLGAFAKTKLLAPGESETVTLTLNARDMASYDWNDANGNGFKGYELDEGADGGAYEIKVMRDSHTPVGAAVFYTVPVGGCRYETDTATGAKVENLFDDVSEYVENRGGYLSRSDFAATFPKAPTADDRAETQAFISSLNYNVNFPGPWDTDEMPTQSRSVAADDKITVKLYELIGAEYDDARWDEMLNQLTVGQMQDLVNSGNFNTGNIGNIDKPQTIDADGPMGFAIFMGDPSVYDTAYYASECVMGATWNAELAEEMGKMVGNEGLIGDERGDGRPYSGWYAPAMNLHRSQFGGRNFEYYSEDGLLSGKLAAAVVRGAKSKGVYTYCKHFALNDQETSRDANGLVTWANEQAMREQYFLPFETAVKEGGATAFMSSFNRVGKEWAGGNHTLLTKLLRDEWGFRGAVITDFNVNAFMNLDQMVRAGGDLSLSAGKAWNLDNSATTVTALRQATKNILYTVANSNAMNGMGEGVAYRYALPLWQVWLLAAAAVIFALCLAWGAWAVLSAGKKQTAKDGGEPPREADDPPAVS